MSDIGKGNIPYTPYRRLEQFSTNRITKNVIKCKLAKFHMFVTKEPTKKPFDHSLFRRIKVCPPIPKNMHKGEETQIYQQKRQIMQLGVLVEDINSSITDRM